MRIAKLDAARRQLDCAIRLWFSDDDPVVIHALAWSAYQIVEDINEKKGNKSATLLSIMREVVPAEKLAEAMQWAKKPMTFFKHANRDPQDILDFNPETSSLMFMLCTNGLAGLGERMSDVERVYMFWTRLHSDKMLKKSASDNIPVEYIEKLRLVPKEQFLKDGLVLMAQLRAQGKI